MKTKNLDDLLPKEFVEQRKKLFELKELKKQKSTYWDFLGELGFFMGFDAVAAVLNDFLELEQATELLRGAKKAYYSSVYDQGVAALAGARGVHKSAEFGKLMKFYEREMR